MFMMLFDAFSDELLKATRIYALRQKLPRMRVCF